MSPETPPLGDLAGAWRALDDDLSGCALPLSSHWWVTIFWETMAVSGKKPSGKHTKKLWKTERSTIYSGKTMLMDVNGC